LYVEQPTIMQPSHIQGNLRGLNKDKLNYIISNNAFKNCCKTDVFHVAQLTASKHFRCEKYNN